MRKDEKIKLQQELQNKERKEKVKQPDPYTTNRTLYNPTTGDLYITISDENGNVRRNVINLLSD